MKKALYKRRNLRYTDIYETPSPTAVRAADDSLHRTTESDGDGNGAARSRRAVFLDPCMTVSSSFAVSRGKNSLN